MAWPGEDKLWEILLKLDPDTVSKNAGAAYNAEAESFELKCLGQEINVSLRDKEITALSEIGEFMVNDLGEYSRLSILSYLTGAKEIPLSGDLVRPSDLPGGGIFIKGTHVVPVDSVALRFGDSPEELIDVERELGGLRREYGDVSIELLPFRRIPVTIIVWAGDEDFPPKASLLMDSTCTLQMPIDILWAVAMMVVKTVMRGEKCGPSCCNL